MTPEPMVAMPSAPTMMSSLQPDMTSTVSSLAADSGDKYSLPGQRNKLVSAAEFQAAINEYEARFPPELAAAVSPKAYDTSADYASILVYRCMGAYRGDEYCIKCPLRKTCITRR